MSSSYLLSLRDTSAYTMPANFSAYSISWGECMQGFATQPVNYPGNNNKICVPLPDSKGRIYLNGPLPQKCKSGYRRHTKNLYGAEEYEKAPPLCLPPVSQCLSRTEYLPASQALYDRPVGPDRQINFREEVGRAPPGSRCMTSGRSKTMTMTASYCDQCPGGVQREYEGSGTPSVNGDPSYDWDYVQMNDYFRAPVHRWNSNGYNAEELRAPRSIHTTVPISPKWDAYRVTLTDVN